MSATTLFRSIFERFDRVMPVSLVKYATHFFLSALRDLDDSDSAFSHSSVQRICPAVMTIWP